MKTISPSYIALAVMIIISLAGLLGVELEQQALTVLVGEVATILGAVYVLYRKINKGEINIFGVYKK